MCMSQLGTHPHTLRHVDGEEFPDGVGKLFVGQMTPVGVLPKERQKARTLGTILGPHGDERREGVPV
jgi:hypothetical protein